jgi:diacylglycerol O-acyltransferase / wax synthase
MERLKGVDASFLYMETRDMHMHTVGTVVIDPATMPGGYAFAKIKELLASRLHLMAPFRRRLVMVPFDLAHPVWIEDPDFDLEFHVHRRGLPQPGTMHELAELVGDFASRPLDRSRPLWQMWVVEGLEDGLVALVTKIHHSCIDGVSGADLMAHLFDLEPEPPEIELPPALATEQPPSDVKLIAGALSSVVTQPFSLARTMVRTGRGLIGAVQSQRKRPEGAPPATLPFTAPTTPWNGAITPHRAVAFSSCSLEDMKLVKRVFGTTVNDVVLAACTMSLRRWLEAHDALPDRPLVASIPVSVHTADNKTDPNQISTMFVSLPVQLSDPVEQLVVIRENTKGAKELHHAMGADLIMSLTQATPPQLLNLASRLYSQMNLASRHRPAHNLVVSNVPGPPIPLYCGGARVVSCYPMGPILEGAGLNLTVLSNMGNVDFGAIACREMVPDLWDIADGFAEAVTELRKRAEEQETGKAKPSARAKTTPAQPQATTDEQ